MLEVAPEFSEISDLMSRYATLRVTNEELLQRDATNSARIDQLRSHALRCREQYQVDVLNANNRLAALQKQLEKDRTEARYW